MPRESRVLLLESTVRLRPQKFPNNYLWEREREGRKARRWEPSPAWRRKSLVCLSLLVPSLPTQPPSSIPTVEASPIIASPSTSLSLRYSNWTVPLLVWQKCVCPLSMFFPDMIWTLSSLQMCRCPGWLLWESSRWRWKRYSTSPRRARQWRASPGRVWGFLLEQIHQYFFSLDLMWCLVQGSCMGSILLVISRT